METTKQNTEQSVKNDEKTFAVRPQVTESISIQKQHVPDQEHEEQEKFPDVKEYQFDDSEVNDSRRVEAQIENNPAIPIQPRES